MSNMLGLWVKNSLTTYAKRKLSALMTAYTFNTQDDGTTLFLL